MDMLIFGVPVVGITIALTEVVKRIQIPYLSQPRWSPIVAMAVGVGLAYIAGEFKVTPEMVISGIVIGLSASGLYSGTKAVIKK